MFIFLISRWLGLVFVHSIFFCSFYLPIYWIMNKFIDYFFMCWFVNLFVYLFIFKNRRSFISGAVISCFRELQYQVVEYWKSLRSKLLRCHSSLLHRPIYSEGLLLIFWIYSTWLNAGARLVFFLEMVQSAGGRKHACGKHPLCIMLFCSLFKASGRLLAPAFSPSSKNLYSQQTTSCLSKHSSKQHVLNFVQ